jgi:glycerol-3-phosphate acyltransferase PlsY
MVARTVPDSPRLPPASAADLVGAPWFAVVFTLDFAKGFVPAFWLSAVAIRHGDAPAEIGILYGVAAMAGHIWPLYLKFKGGKGVATAAGAVTGISPLAAGLAGMVFIGTLQVWRMVSLGSIAAAVSLPIAYVIVTWGESSPIVIGAFVFMMLLVIWKHRANIGRIFRGEEPRIFGGKKEASDA